jgi:multidrug efflux pump subunit AcrA (membrane-fusion protein)
MKKAIITLFVLVALAVLAASVGPRLLNRTAQEEAPTSLVQATDQTGQTYVTVQGTIMPARWMQLSFPLGGYLTDVGVSVGITVTAGQTLATLSTAELELDVQLAESALAAREANLSQLQNGPTSMELEVLEASYEATVAAYEKLKEGPTSSERSIAEADLKIAEREVEQAQAAYDAVRGRPDLGSRPEAMQLERATLEYQRAKASYELAMAGPDRAALKGALSQVVSAKYQLEKARSGTDLSTLRSAEAAVMQARADLSRSQTALNQAVLKAPFDGVITSVTKVETGDLISAGQAILTIADLSQLQVEIKDLDEWGAANVTRNQSVDLVVTALNNLAPRGRLAYIAQEPTISANGVATYLAIVTLDTQEPGLLWGMTVRAKLYLPVAKRAGFR